MAPQVAEYTNAFMKEQYYKIIKNLAGGEDGSPRIVFPTIESVQSPIGGDGVPESCTNHAMYEAADALLRIDNKWYTPSSAASYFGELKTYMEQVVIKTDSSPAAREALERALARQTKAMEAFAKVKKSAREEWKESQEYEPSDYLTWVINNRPDVANAENEADSAAAEVYAAQAAIGGPGSDELSTIRSRLLALFKNQNLPGYSFKTSPTGQLELNEYIKNKLAGKDVPKPAEPQGTIWKAAYNYSGLYSNRIDDLRKLGGEDKWESVTKFKCTVGSEENKRSGGSSGTGGGVDFGWLSFKAGDSESWSESSVNSAGGEIEVEISIKAKLVVDVSPGNWDVPGYRRKYPNISSSAPPMPKDVVKPVGMLIASGLRCKIKFDGATKTAFDEEYHKVTGGSGGLSIFGIRIYFGTKPKDEHSETHKATYDGGPGVLTIEPVQYLGSANLLALIGEKIDS